MSHAAARLAALARERPMRRGTARVQAILDALGNPEARLRVVHVAGTNGKGSVAAMVASMLREGGHRVGLFTSPAWDGLDAGILVNGKSVDAARTDKIFARIEPRLADSEGATAFEAETALALAVFEAEGVNVAVVECGLGGEGDATNVFAKPLVTVVTNVGVEHVHILGDDVGVITLEKAGILREGVPCVTAARGDAHEVLSIAAEERGAPFVSVGEDVRAAERDERLDGNAFRAEGLGDLDGPYLTGLPGAHQIENALTALATVSQLPASVKPSRAACARGLAETRLAGRLEWFPARPGEARILLDGAHNPAATAHLAAYLAQHEVKPVALFGVLEDKDHLGMVEILTPVLKAAVVTQPPSPRGRAAMDSAREFSRKGVVGTVVEDSRHAFATAMSQAGEGGVVLVTGSLLLVAALRKLILARKG